MCVCVCVCVCVCYTCSETCPHTSPRVFFTAAPNPRPPVIMAA